jgi:hypothetical protein
MPVELMNVLAIGVPTRDIILLYAGIARNKVTFQIAGTSIATGSCDRKAF